jgi:uncharacterized protein YraI
MNCPYEIRDVEGKTMTYRRRWMMVVLVAALVAAPLVIVSAQEGVIARVIPDTLNVRERPGYDAAVIGQYPRGTALRVTGWDGTLWVYAVPVEGGLSGWAHWDYVDFPDGFDVSTLPIIDAAGSGAGAPPPGLEAPPSVPLAEGQLSGVTANDVNLRAGPGTGYAVIRALLAGTPVALIGRNADGTWLHAQAGDHTGWLYAVLVSVSGDALSLPVVMESAPPPAAPAAAPNIPPGVIPTVGARARQIFLAGQARGNRPSAFSKVGDSITDMPMFLYAIDAGNYDLGEYGTLQATINRFAGSFGRVSAAAHGNWTSYDLLDPSKNFLPGACGADESPLACEYRVWRPAVALIMIGTNDITYGVDPAAYRANLETIVQISIDSGVIPVLSTIPDNHTGPDAAAQVGAYNEIVRSIAAAYGVPLWDFWLALQALPNKGMAADNYHPSFDTAATSAAIFTAAGLQYGFNMRNLSALLVLDAVSRGAMY